jgi:NADPH-dependent 2,4-dienoyl-CoA reductase/sulfur reductase-like enzyme
MSRVDLLIIGAGPAGMAAAITARRHGLEVRVVDDQPAPGGQIWRSVEMAAKRDDILGPSYSEGRAVAEAFRTSGALYEPDAQLWQLEPGFKAFISKDRQPEIVEAQAVILATGAQERPVPFPGWTLPGVLTVGAAQILLKNAGQIPAGPVWIAGSGPLPLLYAVQLLRAGGVIAGYLDTTPPEQLWSALRYLPGALRSTGELFKGLGWLRILRRGRVPVVKGVVEIEALGNERLEALRYRTNGGAVKTIDAETLLVHEGVVPSIHAALSLDCDVAWTPAQECFAPVVDHWGESSRVNLFIAGDGAGIAGAKAALLRGELAALRVAVKLGRLSEKASATEAHPVRRKLGRELAVRPFLDALFRPRSQIFAPADETVICRCEEVTAREIRALANVGRPGPNQIKGASRAGMGPCQGRQCGYTVNRLLAAAQDRSPAEVGFYRVRPPLKPVTLGEFAALDSPSTPRP